MNIFGNIFVINIHKFIEITHNVCTTPLHIFLVDTPVKLCYHC